MEIVTIENKAFKSLCDKIDKVHEELLRLQNPAKQLSNEYVDTNDVMNILMVSRRTLTQYLSDGKLKYTKTHIFERSVRIPCSSKTLRTLNALRENDESMTKLSRLASSGGIVVSLSTVLMKSFTKGEVGHILSLSLGM